MTISFNEKHHLLWQLTTNNRLECDKLNLKEQKNQKYLLAVVMLTSKKANI